MREEKFKFEFTFVELQIILKGLEELPYKQVAGTRQNLIDQYTAAIQVIEQKAKEEQQAKEEVKVVEEKSTK